MENLFNYATKELSQDAFLMWLMANYNCEEDKELKDASRKFICKLFAINNIDINENDILNAEVYPQKNKIDIYAIIDIKDKGKYGVFIEDKTSSFEHNQLAKYNNNIKKIKNSDKLNYVLKIFYKSHLINNEERKRIIDAEWKEFVFDDVYNFFIEYKDVNNIILSQYSKYIEKLYLDSNNKEKPNDNNINAWESYFRNVIKLNIDDISDSWIVEERRYHYVYMGIRYKGHCNEEIPFLELRSKDLINNKFTIRFLLPKNTKEENVDKFINDINGSLKLLKIKKYTKQIAKYNEDKIELNTKNIIEITRKVINEYNEIIKFWD